MPPFVFSCLLSTLVAEWLVKQGLPSASSTKYIGALFLSLATNAADEEDGFDKIVVRIIVFSTSLTFHHSRSKNSVASSTSALVRLSFDVLAKIDCELDPESLRVQLCITGGVHRGCSATHKEGCKDRSKQQDV